MCGVDAGGCRVFSNAPLKRCLPSAFLAVDQLVLSKLPLLHQGDLESFGRRLPVVNLLGYDRLCM